MSYGEQYELERQAKKHKQDLEEAEHERELAERETRRVREDALRHTRELTAERDDAADEAAQNGRLLTQAKRFIKERGLEKEFEEWKREQPKRFVGDDE